MYILHIYFFYLPYENAAHCNFDVLQISCGLCVQCECEHNMLRAYLNRFLFLFQLLLNSIRWLKKFSRVCVSFLFSFRFDFAHTHAHPNFPYVDECTQYWFWYMICAFMHSHSHTHMRSKNKHTNEFDLSAFTHWIMRFSIRFLLNFCVNLLERAHRHIHIEVCAQLTFIVSGHDDSRIFMQTKSVFPCFISLSLCSVYGLRSFYLILTVYCSRSLSFPMLFA